MDKPWYFESQLSVAVFLFFVYAQWETQITNRMTGMCTRTCLILILIQYNEYTIP